ncbi:MAG: hypothetical protein ACLUPV_00115 [Bilophila wadsworthia]
MRGVPGAVFVPAILGTAANNDVHNAIKDRTGHIVNEISSLPPAVTGCACTPCSCACSRNTMWISSSSPPSPGPWSKTGAAPR